MIFVRRVEDQWSIGTDSLGEATKQPFVCIIFPEGQVSWEEVLIFVADQEVAVERSLKAVYIESFHSHDGREFALQEMWGVRGDKGCTALPQLLL